MTEEKEYKRCHKCVHSTCQQAYDYCTPECHAYQDHAPWCICVEANYDRDGICQYFEEKKKPEEIR